MAANFSAERKNIAIVEVALFSLIQLVQFITRFVQEWRFWHHEKSRSIGRCLFYSWFGLIGLLAQLRITGSAMVLANPQPSKSALITQYVLQNIGLSPLLFEVSFVLLLSGQAREIGPRKSKHPKAVRFALHFFRFPIFISLVGAIVGRFIEIRAGEVAGSFLFVISFISFCGYIAMLAVKSRAYLTVAGYHGVLLILVALHFLAVRIIYLLLGEYGRPGVKQVIGNNCITVGMGLLMEIIVVMVLFTARMVVEPIWSIGGGYERVPSEWNE